MYLFRTLRLPQARKLLSFAGIQFPDRVQRCDRKTKELQSCDNFLTFCSSSRSSFTGPSGTDPLVWRCVCSGAMKTGQKMRTVIPSISPFG
jgi:hypothetical protein